MMLFTYFFYILCLLPAQTFLRPNGAIFARKFSLFTERIIRGNKHKAICKPRSEKKLITISPGGLKGFYQAGIVAYLKEHYDLHDFIFSGASAGAWCSLLAVSKRNITELIYNLVGDHRNMYNNESIRDLKFLLKHRILDLYHDSDFDLDRVYIGTTNFFTLLNNKWFRIPFVPIESKTDFVECRETKYRDGVFIKTRIYSNFTTLEDALDCCIASSHIPFLMGRILHQYNGQYVFDGGFSNYPYYSMMEPVLQITPNIWEEVKPEKNTDGWDGWDGWNLFINRFKFKTPIPWAELNIKDVKRKHREPWLNMNDYTTLFLTQNFNFIDLYWKGYNDSHQNRAYLDTIFGKSTKCEQNTTIF